MSKSKSPKCPVCGKPKSAGHAPFCSAGCKDRDLLQWLGEGYKVPGPAVPPGRLNDHLSTESADDDEV